MQKVRYNGEEYNVAESRKNGYVIKYREDGVDVYQFVPKNETTKVVPIKEDKHEDNGVSGHPKRERSRKGGRNTKKPG